MLKCEMVWIRVRADTETRRDRGLGYIVRKCQTNNPTVSAQRVDLFLVGGFRAGFEIHISRSGGNSLHFCTREGNLGRFGRIVSAGEEVDEGQSHAGSPRPSLHLQVEMKRVVCLLASPVPT